MGTVEFNSQFKILEHKLLPTAYRLTNNYEDARDLVQETAMRAFTNRRKFEMGTNFQAWVITIMRNTFINFYRKKKNRNTRCEPTGSFVFEKTLVPAENEGDSNIMMKELMGMLNQLSDTYKVPFEMFFEGYKYEEIGVQLNVPVGTVKSRIFFARQKLKGLVLSRYPQSMVA
jgi:RNA polymerase sigma-70 factor (ECF subfamily)